MKKIFTMFAALLSAAACYAQDAALTFTVGNVSFTMVHVEGGTFTMGATAEQDGCSDKDEKPAHEVTLPSYHIGETEVTQQLWTAVMGSNPSRYRNPMNPVEEVSWADCQEFISRLNGLTGQEFRLPTEAEWEFAARGGNLSKGYRYSGRDTAKCGDPKDHDRSVKKGEPNELGIYGMSGNVWEWCSDWYGRYPAAPSEGRFRVNRGGSYCGNVSGCRVSDRGYNVPTYRGGIGLRLAMPSGPVRPLD